ncbi:hypothetical protein LTR91_025541 [Friedmanniomyces endolithicus]|uniref:Uncharacterized protein n=1 Tax=Friedmanniomyces endolithicus TaxID=329885 RepID=A0AAN6GYL0_9PEZI|nr:hypothetical protein LTR94_021399 [Friedmanniomyces endolithicus]KAK0769412.1 hypothetical protein LTR59_017052 [Friedmanniomyces endolithicus]KAK0770264.1 hypothetical protein LTR38_017627 [Friedmanniomyces endolithicus]KAK0771268.1 hypothetical protein LTR75_017707 [Friedmanniomyces endolithicus]KAK0827634.1 hypothetical protein LTR03_016791 [Friedmanniomyces endolithicus]
MAAAIFARPMRVPQGTVIPRPGKFEPHITKPNIHLPDGHVILPMTNKMLPVSEVSGLNADSLPSADSVEMAAEVGFTGPE